MDWSTLSGEVASRWGAGASCRLMVYGDSISKGVVFEEGKYRVLKDCYAGMLQSMLGGSLFNRSKFGITLDKAMSRSMDELLKDKPDIALIEFGGNDCDFRWEEIAADPAARHDPNTAFDRFSELLESLVSRLADNGVLPILMNLPPLDAERYFNWISRSGAEAAANILKWLGATSRIYWWQERYNAAIADVASRTGAMLIDIRSGFLRHPDYRDFLCIDGIHPNAEGHRIIAERVIGALRMRFDGLFRPSGVELFKKAENTACHPGGYAL